MYFYTQTLMNRKICTINFRTCSLKNKKKCIIESTTIFFYDVGMKKTGKCIIKFTPLIYKISVNCQISSPLCIYVNKL